MAGNGRAIALYVRALDLSAIHVVGPDSGRPCAVGFSGIFSELTGQPPLAPREKPKQHRALWCVSQSQAQAVLDAAELAHDGAGWIDEDADRVTESLRASAAKIGAHVEDDVTVEKLAVQALIEIDARLQELQRAGEMKSVNKSYREYRIAKTAQGERAQPYRWWMENYRIKLIRLVASTGRLLDRHAFGELKVTK